MPITEVAKVLKRIKKESLENDTWPEQLDINLNALTQRHFVQSNIILNFQRDTVTSNYILKGNLTKSIKAHWKNFKY